MEKVAVDGHPWGETEEENKRAIEEQARLALEEEAAIPQEDKVIESGANMLGLPLGRDTLSGDLDEAGVPVAPLTAEQRAVKALCAEDRAVFDLLRRHPALSTNTAVDVASLLTAVTPSLRDMRCMSYADFVRMREDVFGAELNYEFSEDMHSPSLLASSAGRTPTSGGQGDEESFLGSGACTIC
ncbi:hypothetical protein EON66_06345 [archaeon]|nr:MAG: hypothetical protein EON66_06345 [archaeon]